MAMGEMLEYNDNDNGWTGAVGVNRLVEKSVSLTQGARAAAVGDGIE